MLVLDSLPPSYTAEPLPVHGAFGVGASPKSCEPVAEGSTASVGRPLTEREAAFVAGLLPYVRVRSLVGAITVRDGVATITLSLLPLTDMPLLDAARMQAVAAGNTLEREPLPHLQPEAPPARTRRAQDPAGLGLTDRQRDVLALLGEGKPNEEIGAALGLTAGTVKVHVTAIFKALGAINRTQAVIRAAELGLVGADLTARGA